MGIDQVVVNPDLTTLEISKIQEVLNDFSNVFSDIPGLTNVITHEIRTIVDEPVVTHPYPIPHALQDTVRKELDVALKLNIIREVENIHCPSSFCSPILLVRKKDKSVRLVNDFRKLNSISHHQRFPLPNINHVLDLVSSARYLSIFDLCKGYNQIAILPSDVHKTGFVALGKHFVYLRMPFGLQGAGATFQNCMNIILEEHRNYAIAFVDDICIFSKTFPEHLDHLRKVLDAFRCAGLTIKPTKAKIAYPSVVYLGHQVGSGFKGIDGEKLSLLSDIPTPSSKKEVRSFLGFVGYYRDFIQNFSIIAAPLSDLLRKEMPNLIQWNTNTQTAFDQLKSCLSKHPVLAAPDFDKQFYISVDASLTGMGASLMQLNDKGVLQPCLFISKKFSPAESRYSNVEREALAIVIAINKFKYYILGTIFVVLSDCKALTALRNTTTTNPRLLRWSLNLSEYAFEVQHVSGKLNVSSDFLSRINHKSN
jgi:hypothetical protein